jgi:hypothetical protein
MRTLVNDLEPLMPQRLSSKLQCFADSVLSYGNVASRLPILPHSSERHLIKETEVTVEEMVDKSKTPSFRSLNSTIVYTVE